MSGSVDSASTVAETLTRDVLHRSTHLSPVPDPRVTEVSLLTPDVTPCPGTLRAGPIDTPHRWTKGRLGLFAIPSLRFVTGPESLGSHSRSGRDSVTRVPDRTDQAPQTDPGDLRFGERDGTEPVYKSVSVVTEKMRDFRRKEVSYKCLSLPHLR